MTGKKIEKIQITTTWNDRDVIITDFTDSKRKMREYYNNFMSIIFKD